MHPTERTIGSLRTSRCPSEFFLLVRQGSLERIENRDLTKMLDRGKNELIELMRKKPWQAEPAPSYLSEPKGLIGEEERNCYYWLGKEWFRGEGFIVDAGAFAGASTFCFAAGVNESGHHSFNGQPPVHAYDFFKVVDDYVREAISRDFRPVLSGESYLDVFEYQTGRFSHLITPHPGDFMLQRWTSDPIEILFIDISKTLQLNAHVVSDFFPCLMPNKSIVVHQDYYHCWHPYIHYTMEYFKDEFELIDEYVAHQSCVWRLVKPLPKEKIDRIARNQLDEGERMKLLGNLINHSSDVMRPMIEVVRLWQACSDGQWDWAEQEFGRLSALYDHTKRPELWALQLADVGNEIKRRTA